jgi:SOS-response transcriptional repressor LexA
MDKLIEDGGWIVVDPDQKDLQHGKSYLIQNAEHEVTVKLYQRSPARFEPMSTNDEHKSFLVSDAEFFVLGRVVWKGAPL